MAGDPTEIQPEYLLAAVLLLDVKGSSKLDQHDREHTQLLYDTVARTIKECGSLADPDVSGDGFCGWFKDTFQAARCAFEIRHLFRDLDWEAKGVPALLPRIALHCGQFLKPLNEGLRLRGNEHIQPARLEPMVTPGEIWATEAFAILFLQRESRYVDLEFVGERELAKGFGTLPAYRLREHEEPQGEVPSLDRPALRRYREPLALWLEMSRSGSEQQQLAALDSLGVIGSDQAVERLREVAENRQAAFRYGEWRFCYWSNKPVQL